MADRRLVTFLADLDELLNDPACTGQVAKSRDNVDYLNYKMLVALPGTYPDGRLRTFG